MRPLALYYNDAFKAYLKEKSIYLNKGAERLKPDQKLLIAAGAVIEPYTAFTAGFYLCSMGSFSYSHAVIPQEITSIGRYCSIAMGLGVLGPHHPYQRLSTSSFTYDKVFPIYADYLAKEATQPFKVTPRDESIRAIEIGHDVWIGQKVTLSRGIKLGHGCIVGANALVTKDVPPYAIVGGVPAKVIKYRFAEPVVERLLASQWWHYGFDAFGEEDAFLDPLKTLDLLDRKRDQGLLRPFAPTPLVADEGLLKRIADASPLSVL